MPRSNRPRGRRRPADDERDLASVIFGGRRSETRRNGEWVVQPISAAAAQKSYTCPACPRPIEPGTAHVVVWRADSFMGDDAAVADRRHWHSHCWKIG